jgi:hypothetical protein
MPDAQGRVDAAADDGDDDHPESGYDAQYQRDPGDDSIEGGDEPQCAKVAHALSPCVE